VLSREQIAALKADRPELGADVDFKGTKPPRVTSTSAVSSCAAPNDLPEYHDLHDVAELEGAGGAGVHP
jgi:hypothetical protein